MTKNGPVYFIANLPWRSGPFRGLKQSPTWYCFDFTRMSAHRMSLFAALGAIAPKFEQFFKKNFAKFKEASCAGVIGCDGSVYRIY